MKTESAKSYTTDPEVERFAVALIQAHRHFVAQAEDVVLRHEPWISGAWWRALARAAIEECKR